MLLLTAYTLLTVGTYHLHILLCLNVDFLIGLMSDWCITNNGQLQGNYFCPIHGSLLNKVLEYESLYGKTLLQPGARKNAPRKSAPGKLPLGNNPPRKIAPHSH